MESRLSLSRRNAIAIELRQEILKGENPERLAGLEHPDVQPAKAANGTYAFEFFLNRYRERIRNFLKQGVAYSFGWSDVSLLRDEQTRSTDRYVRMCSDLLLQSYLDAEKIESMAQHWKMEELNGFTSISDSDLELFCFEIAYEICREMARERAEERYEK